MGAQNSKISQSPRDFEMTKCGASDVAAHRHVMPRSRNKVRRFATYSSLFDIDML